MKPRRHDGGRHPTLQIAHQLPDGRAGIEHEPRRRAATGTRPPRVGARSRPGERLELDRRLPLVADPCRRAAQRADGVEQPADARRQRRQLGRVTDPADGLPVGGRDGVSERPRQRRCRAERCCQPRRRHSPRLTDGGRAAGHPHRPQPAGALVAAQVADQQLPTPHGAVGTEAGSVEDRPDRRRGDTVLGQASGEMGVVVLDPDELHLVELQRVLGRQVVGMQIVRDHLRRHGEHPLEVTDPLQIRRQRRQVLQITDVMTDPRPIASGDAERRLLLGPAGEQRPRRRDRQRQRLGHVAAGAAQHQRAARGRCARPNRRSGSRSLGRGRGTRRRSRPSRSSASSS